MLTMQHTRTPAPKTGRETSPSVPVGLLARFNERAGTVPATGKGVFSSRARRAGRIWVIATLPLATLAGLLVHDEATYLVAWVLVSGLYTTPALLTAWFVVRRSSHPDQAFWRLWGIGLTLVYTIGLALLVMVFTGFGAMRHAGGAGVVLATIVFTAALLMMMRSRSGGRAILLDVVESGMLVVGIVSLAPLAVGERILSSPAAWFTIPAAFSSVGLISAFCWSLSLYRRLEDERRVVEGLGVVLAFVGAIDSLAQIAQGISGFSLAPAPLLMLQALCMGLVMLTPLHLRKNVPVGLDRLPPQAQVRGGSAAAFVPLALLGALFAEVTLVDRSVPWALPYFGSIALALLVLSTVRHLLVTHETKRLYATVERAADERRRLLSEVMQSVDHDRHRFAAQLHEQATSSYVAFASYLRSRGQPPTGASDALVAVGDDLARQAESIRQLMLAVRPLDVGAHGPRSLSAPIRAYVHSLYADSTPPAIEVHVDDDLALDWTTETLVFRILQEALRNVWRHAGAHKVKVDIDFEGSDLRVRVCDDGGGFDPSETLFESGIASMKAFAALSGGSVSVESERGGGTTVTALFGAGSSQPLEAEPVPTATGGYKLRLIEGGAPAMV